MIDWQVVSWIVFCCICLFCFSRIINKIKPVVTGGFGPPKVVLHQWPADCRGIGGFTALGWPDVSLVAHC